MWMIVAPSFGSFQLAVVWSLVLLPASITRSASATTWFAQLRP
jgi:hypothetical protein